MTDEATKLAGIIRWELGMAGQSAEKPADSYDWEWPDDYPFRVVGPRRLLYDSDCMWAIEHDSAQGCVPDLADPSTLDVLWGQLERRFRSLGWTEWMRDTDDEGLIVQANPARGRGVFWLHVGESALEALLAGYRKVTELEEKNAET